MPSDIVPRVSVVIPAYNAARVLPECLAALNTQSHPRVAYEIIVVDDGSLDGTAEAAVRAGADHVIQCAHAGAAAARNAGLQIARGGVILFTDADCVPEPNWIAEMLRPFEDPLIAGVKGSYRTWQTEVVARLAQCEFEERYDRLGRYAFTDFVDSNSAAFRRAALDAVGGFDPALPHNEDVDLSYRLAALGYHFAFNRKATVYHRHADSWSRYMLLKMRRGYWRMLVYRLHPGKALADSYTPQSLKVQIGLAGAMVLLGSVSALWPRQRRRTLGAAALAGAAFLLSAVPFARHVAQHDPGVLAWAPIFVLARAAAFAAGVSGGAARALLNPFRSKDCIGLDDLGA